MSSFALFGDVIFPVAPELHLQGFVGRANLGVAGRSGNAAAIATPSGFSFTGAVSTEFRTAAWATFGLTARLTWAPLSVSEKTGTDVPIFVPALLVTGRYD